MKAYIKNLAEALYRSAEHKSKPQLSQLSGRAIELLRRRRLWASRLELLRALQQAHERQDKTIGVTLTSKYPLSDAELRAIKSYIRRLHELEPEVTAVIDGSVGGGCRVEFGDIRLDFTLDGQMTKLQNHLTNA